jgi:hypothetical protein
MLKAILQMRATKTPKIILLLRMYLVKDWILGLEPCTNKVLDILIGAWLLPTKLIARESQYLQS